MPIRPEFDRIINRTIRFFIVFSNRQGVGSEKPPNSLRPLLLLLRRRRRLRRSLGFPSSLRNGHGLRHGGMERPPPFLHQAPRASSSVRSVPSHPGSIPYPSLDFSCCFLTFYVCWSIWLGLGAFCWGFDDGQLHISPQN